MRVFDGAAYVFSCALRVPIFGEQLWTQVFHCVRVGHENRVSGSRHAPLAYCSLDHLLWYYEMVAGAHWPGCGIMFRKVFESAFLLRN